LESFVKSAHQAGFVACGQNLESLKDFSKRIGSNVQVHPDGAHNTKGRFSPLTSKKPGFIGFFNLRLAGQSLQISYQNPWPLLAQRRRNSNWWTVLHQVRTHFERQGA
jgi:hypothetical protein